MSAAPANGPAPDTIPVDWRNVEGVLVVRLRSIGDTVLATPTLRALREFLPHARIDILLEDWVAPLLEGHDAIDSVISVPRTRSGRLKTAALIRKNSYDVAINLHGGTTSTFLTRATGAKHRIGYADYQFPFFYDLRLSSSSDFWDRPETHSAEQQLALAGFAGVPVRHRPPSELPSNAEAEAKIGELLDPPDRDGKRFALIHPAASTFTKQWDTAKFARVAEHLAGRGFVPVAVGAGRERHILEELSAASRADVKTFSDLSLPEITALARLSSVFVGNDSGIAHIAAAVKTPAVVVFGSSNRIHWSPWTDADSRTVFREFDCQPCPGFECRAFGSPRCILEVTEAQVISALEDLLSAP